MTVLTRARQFKRLLLHDVRTKNTFYTHQTGRSSDNPTGTKRTPTQDETITKQFRNNYETIVAPAVAYQLYNPLANPPRETTIKER